MLDDFHQVVLDFMLDYGTTATYIQEVLGVYDPATGTASGTSVQTEVQAILQDLTLSSNGLSLRFGTLVVAGDKQLLVRPPERTVPDADPLVINPASDRVTVGGHTYKVVTFKEVNPTGDEVVLIDLYLRR